MSTSNLPGFADTVILVTHDGMGYADNVLQHKLIVAYFKLLKENNTPPAVICFYTDGVKLVVEGSPALEQLEKLEQKGSRLVICGTCLNHFGLADKVRVGIVGGMGDILEAQTRAGKVITL